MANDGGGIEVDDLQSASFLLRVFPNRVRSL